MPGVQLTWLGHASFRFDTPGGKRVYVDPYFDNPKFPENERRPERVDILALTHGHGDHVASAVDLIKEFNPTVVGIIELLGWLQNQGADVGEIPGTNKGGTRIVDDVKFTMTDARHSGGGPNGEYVGDPAGFVIEVENGTKMYFAGDTAVFGDMQLIGRLYSPDVAILPIGGHFTMDPKEAALALELLGSPRCVPCHYGTFPILTGTPAELRELTDAEIVELEPGQTIEL